MADEDEGRQAPRTFTQEEVNALMGQTRREERGKHADYEDLKAKAAKYDEAQEAAKTELERANERAAKSEDVAKALDIEFVNNFTGEYDRPAEILANFTVDVRQAGAAIDQYKVTGELNEAAGIDSSSADGYAKGVLDTDNSSAADNVTLARAQEDGRLGRCRLLPSS